MPKNLGETPSAILGPTYGHFGFCSRCGGAALQAVSKCPGAARLVFYKLLIGRKEECYIVEEVIEMDELN